MVKKKIKLPNISVLSYEFDNETLKKALVLKLLTSNNTAKVFLALCNRAAHNSFSKSVDIASDAGLTSVATNHLLRSLHQQGYLIKKGNGKGRLVLWHLKNEFIVQPLINDACKGLEIVLK